MLSGPVSIASTRGATVTLHHLVWRPAAERLLIAHATGFHGRCYEPMAAALDEFDVWALDIRGHGASPEGEQPVRWDDFGDDAGAAAGWLAEEAGGDGRIAGFGHSLGGGALLMAAERDPGRFRALALYEPIVVPPNVPTRSNPLAAGARRRRRVFDSAAVAYDNFASKPPMSAFDPAALRGYVDGGLAPVDPADPGGPVQLRCRPEHEAATFEAALHTDQWERLPAVAVPVTVLGGTIDESDPPSLIAELIAKQLPSARYERADELDHFAPFVAPTATAARVAAALAGSPRGPVPRSL
jgi:pimeloyl-ACP methyl ester carboxylesterase